MVGQSQHYLIPGKIEDRLIGRKAEIVEKKLLGFQFHLPLLAELIFHEAPQILGKHIPQAGFELQGEIFGGIGRGIQHDKTWAQTHVRLEAAEWHLRSLKKTPAPQKMKGHSPHQHVLAL